jgi:glycerol-3-phosphate dehydrogenase
MRCPTASAAASFPPSATRARTADQVAELAGSRSNERYLPGVELPRDLNIRALGAREDQFSRPDLVFLAVPSKGLAEAVEALRALGVSETAGMVSLTNGLVGPDGTPPAVALEAPVVTALAHLIEGSMPLDDWIAMVRAKQPPPARFSRPRTWWVRLREWFTRTLGPR